MADRIGMLRSKNSIQYTYCDFQKTLPFILDRYYRCPRKVLKLLASGPYYFVGTTVPMSDSMRLGVFDKYESAETFLNIFPSGYKRIFLFKEGTWFVNSQGNEA